MKSRVFNFDEKNKSNRIKRQSEAGECARHVIISGQDKSARPRKRTKKSAKELLVDNAAARTPFLSDAQVEDLAAFAGVSKDYGEKQNGQKVERDNPYAMREGETSEAYLARVKKMFEASK